MALKPIKHDAKPIKPITSMPKPIKHNVKPIKPIKPITLGAGLIRAGLGGGVARRPPAILVYRAKC